MSTQLWAFLGGVLAVLGAVVGAFVRGVKSGEDRAARRTLEERVEANDARTSAERDAARSDDPAGELRRDWRRNV